MLKFVNIKEDSATVEYAINKLEIEIENAKNENITAIKVLHGYGSHGRGGAIFKMLKLKLEQWKRSKFIKNYFFGDKWNIFDQNTLMILTKDKTIYNDEDLNKANPGITIIEI
jgi:hypothetical protein